MVRITTDAAPGQTFEGKVNAINPDVDVATRSLRIQATLPNPDEKLHPGMFANIEVVRTEQKKVLVIPATAVLYAPYGDSVFVIDEKKDAHTGQVQKILRLARGDLVTITSNLNPGDTVVTSGVFKLRPGLPVEVDNKLAPDAQAAPKPDNT